MRTCAALLPPNCKFAEKTPLRTNTASIKSDEVGGDATDHAVDDQLMANRWADTMCSAADVSHLNVRLVLTAAQNVQVWFDTSKPSSVRFCVGLLNERVLKN